MKESDGNHHDVFPCAGRVFRYLYRDHQISISSVRELQCCLWCLWAQATCMISFKRATSGSVIYKSWAGACLEPGDQCPTSCQNGVAGLTETCYKCNIPPTCEGQPSSHSVHKHIHTPPRSLPIRPTRPASRVTQSGLPTSVADESIRDEGSQHTLILALSMGAAQH